MFCAITHTEHNEYANQTGIKFVLNNSRAFLLLLIIDANQINFEGNVNYTQSYLEGKLKLRGKQIVTIDDVNEGIVTQAELQYTSAMEQAFAKARQRLLLRLPRIQ